MATVSSSTTSTDQEKFLAAKLLERAQLKLVAASVCDKIKQPQGTGTTAYFIRYMRMNVPLEALSEGVAPDSSDFSLEQVTATLEQWGDLITITDVAQLTTSHPLWQEAMELLLDNAQRLIDREVQKVWLDGTNVLYPSTHTSRAAITTSDKISELLLHKARITMLNNGAPNRIGPSNMTENAKGRSAEGNLQGGGHYLLVTSAEVVADIMRIASGLWVSVAQYQNAKAVYNAEVGTLLGFRIVETNFIAKFEILGGTTAAAAEGATSTDVGGIDELGLDVVNGASGALSNGTPYYWKIVRKSKSRGFGEAISMRHSTATGGGDDAMTFTFPSTTGYAYDLYFGASDADAALYLVEENIEPSGTVTVNAVPSNTNPSAPANVNTTGTPDIHPVFIFSKQAVGWVGLQDLKTYVTGPGAEKSDPLAQKRTMGYKFMGKAVILDQNRLLRIEVATEFNS